MSAARRLTVGLVVLLPSVFFLGAIPSAAQNADAVRIDSVDTEGYPDVTAMVTAPATADGSEFDAAAFEVLENGEAVEFTVGRIAAASLEVMLAIDTSGSMEGTPLAAAKAAVGDFLDLLPAQVKVGAVSFGPEHALLAAPTTDRDLVAAKVDQLFISGETALYDAVRFSAAQFSSGASDRVMLVLSDGGDTASQSSLTQAADAVTGIRVDVIELVTPESSRPALDTLAEAGGGTVAATADPSALADLYRLAADTLVNQYRITYQSSSNDEAQLTVRLTTSGDGTLDDSTAVQLPAAEPNAGSAVAEPSPGPDVNEASAPAAVDEDVWTLGLVLGAVSVFAALLLLGLVAVTGDGGRRLARAGLGLRAPSLDKDTATRLKDRVSADVDRVLERRGRRRSLEIALDVAGISLRPGEFIILTLVAAVVAGLLGLAVAGPVGAFLFMVLTPLLARVVVGRRERERRQKFADLLSENLQLMTSSLRAGYGLLQALDAVAREAEEPAGTEFRRVILEIRVGRDPRDAMHALAERMDSRDFDWVVNAIDINREVGGDLASILDTVSSTIRDRQQLVRHVRTLTAEGRMSAYVLTALPLVVALLLGVTNPDYIASLTSGGGLVAVGVGAALLGVGWIWISRLIRLDY